MRPEVAHLTPADRIAIVAYLALLGFRLARPANPPDPFLSQKIRFD
jgi:hypothetical protein